MASFSTLSLLVLIVLLNSATGLQHFGPMKLTQLKSDDSVTEQFNVWKPTCENGKCKDFPTSTMSKEEFQRKLNPQKKLLDSHGSEMTQLIQQPNLGLQFKLVNQQDIGARQKFGRKQFYTRQPKSMSLQENLAAWQKYDRHFRESQRKSISPPNLGLKQKFTDQPNFGSQEQPMDNKDSLESWQKLIQQQNFKNGHQNFDSQRKSISPPNLGLKKRFINQPKFGSQEQLMDNKDSLESWKKLIQQQNFKNDHQNFESQINFLGQQNLEAQKKMMHWHNLESRHLFNQPSSVLEPRLINQQSIGFQQKLAQHKNSGSRHKMIHRSNLSPRQKFTDKQSLDWQENSQSQQKSRKTGLIADIGNKMQEIVNKMGDSLKELISDDDKVDKDKIIGMDSGIISDLHFPDSIKSEEKESSSRQHEASFINIPVLQRFKNKIKNIMGSSWEKKSIRSRPYKQRPESEIYFIRLPPTPYSYVEGLGYISQPPSFSTNSLAAASSVSNYVHPQHQPQQKQQQQQQQQQPQQEQQHKYIPSVTSPQQQPLEYSDSSSSSTDPFIRVPVEFVSNGKPTAVYRWPPPVHQQPSQHHFNHNHQPIEINRQDSTVIKLNYGPYTFNGKPSNVYTLKGQGRLSNRNGSF